MNKVSLLLLLFGFVYSAYLAFEGGIFLSEVIALTTIGLATTIYVLSKKGNNKIIIYVWIAIVVLVVASYISIGVFNAAEVFKHPVKFI
jgi:hypothetical protein